MSKGGGRRWVKGAEEVGTEVRGWVEGWEKGRDRGYTVTCHLQSN